MLILGRSIAADVTFGQVALIALRCKGEEPGTRSPPARLQKPRGVQRFFTYSPRPGRIVVPSRRTALSACGSRPSALRMVGAICMLRPDERAARSVFRDRRRGEAIAPSIAPPLGLRFWRTPPWPPEIFQFDRPIDVMRGFRRQPAAWRAVSVDRGDYQ
jgi:hypothetical protein